MKLTADTSVLVAAFVSWHEQHELAFAALGRTEVVVAHCLLETYSVLTRLPAPHRMAADVVTAFLEDSFADHSIIALSGDQQRRLVTSVASLGIGGGAVFDALIAATCADAGIKLLTLDARARQAYGAIGVSYEVIA
jgi:predicted nucleic acid-binding protein